MSSEKPGLGNLDEANITRVKFCPVEDERTYTAFAGDRLVASGTLAAMLPPTKAYFDAGENHLIFVFEDQTGRQVDFDLRGSLEQVLARALPRAAQAGPGRPRLGVVSREVSLLPRHWEWLEQQPNGASAALRRLVDGARKRDPGGQRARAAADAAFRFMSAMAGNLPGFEEAGRALYGGDRSRVDGLIRDWPPDIRAHVLRLVREALPEDARDPA